MLIFRLCGGLGNQMFQYGFGRYLSLKYDKELFIDASFFNNKNSKRNIGISEFNLDCKISIDDYKSNKFFQNPIMNKYFNYLIFNYSIYAESKVCSFNKLLLRKSNGYFDGYWQSYKYFSSIRNILVKEFVPRKISSDTKILINKIEATMSIGLHIRKSDYLNEINSNIYANCSSDYYLNSMIIMSKKFPNSIFYIFTDDLNWVNLNLNFSNFNHVFVSKSPTEDLYIMSKCKHNIISNSTFSWWSAWLNENNNKEIIAPFYWFTEKSNIKHDIIPDEWIRIPND
jgi:hypothetical protein